MKKIVAMLLALAMLLCFTACTGEEKPQETTQPKQTEEANQTEAPTVEADVPETTAAPEQTQAPVENVKGFCLTFNGVELTPGTTYDAAALPEPGSVYQVPSCAIEGTDNVYSFDAVEITAFNDGTQEIIYAVAIIDPNVTTDEGLYLGDDMARVIELYGEDYEENGTAVVYTRGNTRLTIIVQGGFVVDIEFSWITE